jgi:hypothetical protein
MTAVISCSMTLSNLHTGFPGASGVGVVVVVVTVIRPTG